MLYSKIEGEGKPLVILHGFLGMSDNWKTLGTQFAELGFETHMLDLRNHGRSFHSDDFNYEVMANDVLDYCKDKNISSAVFLGHSMGGKVVMNLATTHPELVEKLIVADIGTRYYKPHHQEILEGLNAVDFSQQPSRNEVEDILKNYIPDFGTRQFLMKSLYWETPGQLAFRFNLKVFTAKVEEIGKALEAHQKFDKPTLFIKGGLSRYILEEDFESIRNHFPTAIFQTIPNVGHWLHAENPKAFFEIVSEFIR
jgi:esterase